MADKPKLATVLWRGLKRQCPACGQSSSFRGYLKVVDTCAHCGTPLSIYPCDDGPAYVTMLLVGHVVIAPLLAFDVLFTHPPEIVAPIVIGAIAVLTLVVLPFIKGAFLGLMWRLGLKQPG